MSTLFAHFRLSEGPLAGLTSWDDTGLHTITWDGTTANMRAGVQSSGYNPNAVDGWWEITGDDVMYPYPVSQFDVYHKGGTFNFCKDTHYAPETSPIGTFNGIDDEIILDTEVVFNDDFYITFYVDSSAGNLVHQTLFGAGAGPCLLRILGGKWSAKLNDDNTRYFSLVTNVTGFGSFVRVNGVLTLTVGDQTQSINIPTGVSFAIKNISVNTVSFSGIIRNVDINGTLIPINEGEGLDCHDSEGNIIGTYSVTIPTFWNGEPMVSQAIMDMEAASTSGNYLTDGLGHPLPMTQTNWGELGADIVINGQFIYGADDWTLGTGWTVANKVLTYSGAAFGPVVSQLGDVTLSATYNVDCELEAGSFRIKVGSLAYTTWEGTPLTIVADGTIPDINIEPLSATVELSSISIREVNPVMNQNKQYYMTACEGKPVERWDYKTPRTTAEDAEIKLLGCL